jgi:uncharacterized membrane protein YcaP (DUF421 family)
MVRSRHRGPEGEQPVGTVPDKQGRTMRWLFGAGWRQILVPTVPLVEIFLRGTVIYLTLFVLLRFVFKRQYTALGVTDLLVIVLIADAAQNAMSANYRSLTDGLLLVLVIIGWAYVLDWLAFHVHPFERIVRPPPTPLVEDGRMLRNNMRRELVSESELVTRVREEGLDDISKVRTAYLEPDGEISVISKEEHRPVRPGKRRKAI